MAACYDGPAGTQGVGICKAGNHTCNAQGDGYGPCMGEVLPAPVDSCATPEDDDCDGSPMPCQNDPVWSKDLGAQNAATNLIGLATDPQNNTIVATNEGGFTIRKLSSVGATLWTHTFPSNGIGGIAVEPVTGNIWVATGVSGMFDAGCGMSQSFGNQHNLAIIKYSPGGSCVLIGQWGTDFAPGSSTATSIAADAAGNIVVAGVMVEVGLDFGGGQLAAPNKSGETFVAKLNNSMSHVWSTTLESPGSSIAQSVALDSANQAVVTGVFSQSLAVGNLTLQGHGQNDVFLARFDKAGAVQIAKGFGDASDQSEARAAVTAANDIFVSGTFKGTLDFGGNQILAQSAQGDAFLAKFDSSGNIVWSKDFGNGQAATGGSPAAAANGDVYVTGRFRGGLNLGCGNLPGNGNGNSDVFVAHFNNVGACATSQGFGDAKDQAGLLTAVSPNGSPVIGGTFQGAINFGQGALSLTGTTDVFVAKILP
jgi:hypothetical protein